MSVFLSQFLFVSLMTDNIQTPIMVENDPKNLIILYQGLSLEDKVKYIGRGGELPQGSKDFEKLWSDNTFTEK